MASRRRDYTREYQRRNELARQRGFRSYGQQRRYLEATSLTARDIAGDQLSSDLILETLAQEKLESYGYNNYVTGSNESLDIFLRMAKHRGMSDEEAYLTYMEAGGKNGPLSRGRLKALEMSTFNIGEDETWY